MLLEGLQGGLSDGWCWFTNDGVLLGYTECVACDVDSVDEVIATFEERDIFAVEAFVFPLLLRLLVKVVGLGGEDDVGDLGLVQDVEEATVLRIEPDMTWSGMFSCL
jgi:hypothetical protein